MPETEAPRRIHITGASGSGTTTLGRALANQLGLSHFDTDDVYWRPTALPFREKRPEAERLALLDALLGQRRAFVLSGSISGWGGPIEERFDLAVLLRVATPIRLERLRAREELRHGAAAIGAGGWRESPLVAFLDWAARYDDPDFTGRSLSGHQAWLAGLDCPVLTLDGTRPVAELIASVRGALCAPR
ncbi:AAA family ATPase [Oceanibium sediminis]|uniref:AAA family ATPase n=1 Tax=Oceanibium sediminis TaxID=2026339 RepID=UPI000DD4B059|nr:AAA family ATPase [Oceanibium sediminis]